MAISALGLLGAAAAFALYRKGMGETERAWRQVASRAAHTSGVFDPAMVAHLPEVARRYFAHAIAPGTVLRTTVELEMQGTFLLGDKASHQSYAMEARQILRPPFEFVWVPRMHSGLMRITGSDALVDGRAWTRFWLNGLMPVASATTSSDLVRSAQFRSAVEGIWVPASLLPMNGVHWEQIGPDKARVQISRIRPVVVLEMTIDELGCIRQVIGQRWSDANHAKIFRLQPFGGTMEAEATFDGFTIPTRLSVGNHFGTDDYLPFFQVDVTRASYR